MMFGIFDTVRSSVLNYCWSLFHHHQFSFLQLPTACSQFLG